MPTVRLLQIFAIASIPLILTACPPPAPSPQPLPSSVCEFQVTAVVPSVAGQAGKLTLTANNPTPGFGTVQGTVHLLGPGGSGIDQDLTAVWTAAIITANLPASTPAGTYTVTVTTLGSACSYAADFTIGAAPTFACTEYDNAFKNELVKLQGPAVLAPASRLVTSDAATIERVSSTSLSPAAQALQQVLSQVSSTIKFTYNVVAGAGAPASPFAAAPTSRTWQTTLATLPDTIAWGLVARPIVISYDGDPAAQNWPIEIRVDASFPDLVGCAAHTANGLLRLVINQLPIRVPTLVVGYRQRFRAVDGWGGSQAIVFLRSSGLLPSGAEVVDASNLAGQTATMSSVAAVLTSVRSALTALASVFPDLLGVQGLTDFSSFVTRFSALAPANIVFTGEASRDNLDYNPGWWNAISSLWMIGLPDGRTLRLFEDNNRGSYDLHLRIPPGLIAASYWTIHESAFREADRGSFTSAPAIPAPGVLQDGCSDRYPLDSFGDMAKSFEWGTAPAARGCFLTSEAADDIRYEIEHGAVAGDVVMFRLCLGPGRTAEKRMNLPDGGGNSWDVIVKNQTRCAEESLWATQVTAGQSLTFSKYKGIFVGVTAVHSLPLANLGSLPGGARVTFTWFRD